MIARLFFILLLACPGFARAGQDSRSVLKQGHFRLALIEDNPTQLTFFLAQPLERLSKDASSGLEIKSAKMLPCYYSGGNYRFRVPGGLAFSTPSFSAAVLTAQSGKAFVYPPDPDLIAVLERVSADPRTYGRPWSARFSSTTMLLSQSPAPFGAVLTASPGSGKTQSTIWHETAASFYDLSWRGKSVSVILVGERFGGLGRQAQALTQENKKGPLIGVARGEIFGGVLSEIHGQDLARELSAMGLRYSGVGYAELRDWKDLERYRKANPNGVQFISANIVYSSAPKTTLFPDHVVVRAGSLRVAIAAITPPETARYLSEDGLSNVKIIDPVQAVYSRVAAWRKDADAVVLLDEIEPETAELQDEISGVDLILARDRYSPDHAEPPPQTVVSQNGRRPFDPPLSVLDSYETSMDIIDADVSVSPSGSDWSVSTTHRILDDSVSSSAQYPEFDPEIYGISFSTQAALIPPARAIFNDDPSAFLTGREFWTMAASLVAAQTNSELSLLWVWPLPVRVEGSSPIPESVARAWLRTDSSLIVLYLKGSDITPLLKKVNDEAQRDAMGLPPNEKLQFTAGGLDATGGIAGQSISGDETYRVVIPRSLADALGLGGAGRPLPQGLDALVLAALKARAGSPPELYHDWALGRATSVPGLWIVNFRDVSLNLQNTQVVNNGPFGQVPDSRIQGYSQMVLGGDIKVDANYFQGAYKWSNTLETNYAKSRLEPPGQTPISNVSADEIMGLTTLTRKAGSLSETWLAKSWGPSLGLEYDGQITPTPGILQQNTYSLYPGVQLYNGSVINTIEFTGIVMRDLSRVPENTQYGLHTRALFSKSWGDSTLQGEFYANYSFLTTEDNAQDLRVQSDANLKLSIPITDSLNIAPFIDFYLFALKISPQWGYSAMTGVSLQFSQIWKPQYQPL